MKIVLTVHQFLPDFSSGTEILTLSTAKELIKRGHNVVVFTAYPGKIENDDNYIDEYVYEDILVKKYKFNPDDKRLKTNRMEMDYKNIHFKKYFSEFINEFLPDIVHFFHLSRLSASIIDVCKKKKIPMFYTCTDYWAICPTAQLKMQDGSFCSGPDVDINKCLRHLVCLSQSKSISRLFNVLPDDFINILIKSINKKWWPEKGYSSLVTSLSGRLGYLIEQINCIDKILIPTKLMLDMFTKYGLDRNRAIIQSFGIDLKTSNFSKIKYSDNKLTLGFIGTLAEHKGVHIIIKAIKLMDDKLPIELKIYGRESDYPQYVSMLNSIIDNDRRIKFCGTFPNEEIDKIFEGIDVLIVPSIWYENTPLVVYSAQANKTPVIASDVGGITEVIKNDVNGLLFNKGDFVELSKILIKICNNKDIIKNLASNSVMPKSIEQYVDELLNLYSND